MKLNPQKRNRWREVGSYVNIIQKTCYPGLSLKSQTIEEHEIEQNSATKTLITQGQRERKRENAEETLNTGEKT